MEGLKGRDDGGVGGVDIEQQLLPKLGPSQLEERKGRKRKRANLYSQCMDESGKR